MNAATALTLPNIFTGWKKGSGAMSIVSYFLVVFDTQEKSARAGFIYALMTHVGMAFIIALFLILYKYTGHMDFAGKRPRRVTFLML